MGAAARGRQFRFELPPGSWGARGQIVAGGPDFVVTPSAASYMIRRDVSSFIKTRVSGKRYMCMVSIISPF